MAKLNEFVNTYEPETKIKNVSDLDKIQADIDIHLETFKEGTPDEYKDYVVMLNGQKYRMPKSVLIQLKAMLKKSPGLKEFTVSKTGEGMNTTYAVMPVF